MIDDAMTGTEWYSEQTATFGDRMAGAREALGMTQSELSKRLGVKLKTVQSWEDDLSEPRANKLQMLAGILNVSIMWLLTGEGDGLDGPTEEAVLPDDVRTMLTDIRLVKSEMHRLTERLGTLERKLRTALKEQV